MMPAASTLSTDAALSVISAIFLRARAPSGWEELGFAVYVRSQLIYSSSTRGATGVFAA